MMSMLHQLKGYSGLLESAFSELLESALAGLPEVA